MISYQLIFPNSLMMIVSIMWPIPFKPTDLARKTASMAIGGINAAIWFALFVFEVVFLAELPSIVGPADEALASMIIISW